MMKPGSEMSPQAIADEKKTRASAAQLAAALDAGLIPEHLQGAVLELIQAGTRPRARMQVEILRATYRLTGAPYSREQRDTFETAVLDALEKGPRTAPAVALAAGLDENEVIRACNRLVKEKVIRPA